MPANPPSALAVERPNIFLAPRAPAIDADQPPHGDGSIFGERRASEDDVAGGARMGSPVSRHSGHAGAVAGAVLVALAVVALATFGVAARAGRGSSETLPRKASPSARPHLARR